MPTAVDISLKKNTCIEEPNVWQYDAVKMGGHKCVGTHVLSIEKSYAEGQTNKSDGPLPRRYFQRRILSHRHFYG